MPSPQLSTWTVYALPPYATPIEVVDRRRSEMTYDFSIVCDAFVEWHYS